MNEPTLVAIHHHEIGNRTISMVRKLSLAY